MKFLFLLLFILIPMLVKAQGYSYYDHLTPGNDIFGISDRQFDYYAKVRTILFNGLSDRPEIRLIVMPSFTPRNVLDIQKDNKDGDFYLIYRICEKMIDSNKNNEEIKVKEYKSKIDSASVQLIKSLFLKAIKQTKYPENEIDGRDGITYHFFVWDYGLKTGTTWSPQTPNMKKLVKIGKVLIDLAKSDNSIVTFEKGFIEDIERLKNALE